MNFRTIMSLRSGLLLASLLLVACTGSETTNTRRAGDRCLYGVEAEYGRTMQWGSCAHPPPYSVRIGGPD
jgi:hypothetical protein